MTASTVQQVRECMVCHHVCGPSESECPACLRPNALVERFQCQACHALLEGTTCPGCTKFERARTAATKVPERLGRRHAGTPAAPRVPVEELFMPAPDTWRPRVLGETATAGMAYGILGLVLSPFCMFGVIVSLVGMAVAFKDYIKIRTGRLPRSEMPKVIIAWTCGLFALLWTAVALLIFLATTFEPGRAAF